MQTSSESSLTPVRQEISDASEQAGAADERELTGGGDGYRWTALSVTTVGALLASIQGSALLIALPAILVELRASFFTIMWTLMGYLLILTVLTPIVGRLADIWGRKRLYNSGFLLFALGSLVAGLAQPAFHGADLVAGRLIQGLGAALLMTNSTAIVTDAFRKGEVGLGLGINQIAGAAGFLIGPIIGGLLTEWSWRWVFLFNVPLATFGTLWGIWRLREPVRPARQTPIDWVGGLTLALGLSGTLLALTMVAFPLLGESATVAILIVGLLSLLLFATIEPRIKAPIVQLQLFRERLFAMASLSGLLNGIARGAVLFLLIFFLQGPYGKDPLTAGLMLAPFGAAFMIIGPLSGRLSDHIGSRILTPIGLAVSALGLLGLTTITPTTPFWLLSLYMAMMGGGSGFFVSPNTNAIMSSVPPHQRGAASGLLGMLNNTGQMLSIAIVFPLALKGVPMGAVMQVFIYGGGMGQFPSALATFMHGLHSAFLVSFVLSLAAMLVAALRPSHR
ncbi:MFS transporter [Thermogemmatispora aurantia]|uniref:MFS transporter n=1 Tax=Thermogemmatispora aurantia TaxID=2045279 RepID=A0A5J4K501_9CHLR|nr:MFS transporter [Thermogemmatispora aurantia]GER81807.1 MFS transporter [Thermogemmatispora aurantia]